MMRNLDLLIDTITFPSRAFPRIYESTLWLFPLMLLVALSALANGAYFYFVDYNFMLDDMSGGIVDEDVLDDQAEMREAYRSIGRGSLVSVASLTAGLVSLGVAMLYSAYFSLSSSIF